MGHKNVLVVEDNKQSLFLITKVLEKHEDWTIKGVSNGFEALIALQGDTAFDAIILDWEMPEMNGIEFLDTIKQMKDHAHIPVVFLSAGNDREKVIQALKSGALYFMEKPIDFELLRVVIESVTRRCASDQESDSAASSSEQDSHQASNQDPRLQLPNLDHLSEVELLSLAELVKDFLKRI